MIKFGTDGWRAVIADEFTIENVRKVAQAHSDYINSKVNNPKVIVGFDARFMSDIFANHVAKIMSANGIAVVLSDRIIPTPAVSFAVKELKFDSGVVITASHNPAEFNGYKIKTSTGGAADKDITDEVEKLIGKNPVRTTSLTEAKKKGGVQVKDLTKDYVKFLRSYVELGLLKDKKFRVLVDAMHGSGNSFIKEILFATAMKIEIMRGDVNPSFEGRRPEPIAENFQQLLKRVKKDKFDIGLVLDGDADRIAAASSKGEEIIPQKVLALLCLHLIQDRKMTGGIVKTIVGTNLMDNIAADLGVKLYETPVGFKYISKLMIENEIVAGGEEAGGMGFKDYIPERDGSLAGILLLEMMAYRKKNIAKILDEVEARYGRYYYLKDYITLKKHQGVDINRIPKPKEILGSKVVDVKDHDGIKFICQDESWMMLRPSGTEPIVRIYSESKSLKKSQELLQLGKSWIKI